MACVTHGDRVFAQMLDLARRMADVLNGVLVDDNRRPLTEAMLEPSVARSPNTSHSLPRAVFPAGGPLVLRPLFLMLFASAQDFDRLCARKSSGSITTTTYSMRRWCRMPSSTACFASYRKSRHAIPTADGRFADATRRWQTLMPSAPVRHVVPMLSIRTETDTEASGAFNFDARPPN